jgi:Domain of unknown function (DUF4304)
MDLEYNRTLQKHLFPLLKREGFRKHRARWWKDYSETIALFHIQGSHWGPALYINLGIYFRALGSDTRPREVECHLFVRLNEIVPDPMTVVGLLEFSHFFGDEVQPTIRYEKLLQIVASEALPWLERCSTIGGARAEVIRTAPSILWGPTTRRALTKALLDV